MFFHQGSIRVRGQGTKTDDFWDRFQRAVDPPNPQNGPHLWKSYACISYYLALVPPCIYSTISITKNLQHNFPNMKGGLKAVWIFSDFSSDLAQPSFPKPLDQCEIATHWRAFQIQNKSGHGLVKLTHSGENCWCPCRPLRCILKHCWRCCSFLHWCWGKHLR